MTDEVQKRRVTIVPSVIGFRLYILVREREENEGEEREGQGGEGGWGLYRTMFENSRRS